MDILCVEVCFKDIAIIRWKEAENPKEKKCYVIQMAKSACSHLPFFFVACWGFPHSSVGKESTCSAGDPGLIPVSGRSPGEGIGYLL